MSDNSNPQGTGTAELSDADLDTYLDEDAAEGAPELEAGAEGEGETSDEDAGADGEGDAPEAEGEDSEHAEGQADPVVKLDDGTELKLSELAAGYQRQDDYTRKTQALAAKAKEFDAQAAQFSEHARQREQQLEQAFEDVVALLAARMPKEPDLSLAYTDPAAYNQQIAIYNASVKEIQGVMAAQNDARAKLAESQGQDKRRWFEGEMRKVAEAFPIAADPVKGKQFWSSALEVGLSAGFSHEELSQADSREVKLLAELAQYRARDKARANGKDAPKAAVLAQPKRPAPVVRQPVKQPTNSTKALRSFRETRSADAAERAFAAMDI